MRVTLAEGRCLVLRFFILSCVSGVVCSGRRAAISELDSGQRHTHTGDQATAAWQGVLAPSGSGKRCWGRSSD